MACQICLMGRRFYCRRGSLTRITQRVVNITGVQLVLRDSCDATGASNSYIRYKAQQQFTSNSPVPQPRPQLPSAVTGSCRPNGCPKEAWPETCQYVEGNRWHGNGMGSNWHQAATETMRTRKEDRHQTHHTSAQWAVSCFQSEGWPDGLDN